MEDAGRTGRGAGDGALPGSDAMLDEARSGAKESAESNEMDPDHAPGPGSGRVGAADATATTSGEAARQPGPGRLIPCSSCERLVGASAPVCPFCAAEMEHTGARVDVEAASSPPKALPTAAEAGYRTAAVRAHVVLVFFGLWVLIAAAAAVSSFVEWRVLSALVDRPLGVSIAQLEAVDDRQTAFSLFVAGGLAVTAIAFIAWSRRAYDNAGALGSGALRYSKGWLIGGWLVPFVNLWRPKQMMDDLWTAGGLPNDAPGRPATPTRPVSPLLHVWWGLWLIGGFLGRIENWGSEANHPESLQGFAAAHTAADVALALAAVAAFLMVALITRRQEIRAEAILGAYRRQEIIGGRQPGTAGGLLIMSAVVAGVIAAVAFGAADPVAGVVDAGTGVDGEVEGGGVFVTDLKVGDCFSLPAEVASGAEDTVLVVESVACGDVHDFEVFALAPYPAESREPFPGSDEVLVTSLELCAGRMERYVGAPMWVSGLDVYPLVPTRASWVTGDREVLCALTSLDASPIERSMRATGGVVQDGYRSIFGLELGDCFDDSDGNGYIVQLAPCDGPHDNEVFAVLQHPGSADDPYPGDGDLAIYASDACRRSAELAVDPTAAPSLGIGWMTRPVDLTWRLGQREFSCILWDAGFEKIQGSRRAAGSG